MIILQNVNICQPGQYKRECLKSAAAAAAILSLKLISCIDLSILTSGQVF